MLPLLFAAGHHWYARYTIAFLLEMQNLPAAARSDIMSGAPVCRHSDGCESVSAEWADQFGEQIYIRQGKGAGGLKGISTNADQVAVWVASFPICSQLIDTFDDMYPSNGTETHEANRKSHKEEGTKRRQLEAADRQSMRTELQKYSHPLTSPSDHLYLHHYWSGATADVDTHQTVELGTAMRDDLIACYPGGFHHTKQNRAWSGKRQWTASRCMTSTPFSVDCLSLVTSVILQSPTCSTTSLFQSHGHS